MEKGWRCRLVIASATALAWASLAQATTEVVLDNFNLTEGHFNQAPNFSGSNRNLDQGAGVMTADRVTTDGPLEGLGHEKLVLKTAASSWQTPPGEGQFILRFLSGGGSAASNTPFTTSSATDGWIGFYLKTTQANLTVQIWIEGGSPVVNNNSSPKAVINDGQWHLYEWNLDDTTGGPDGWVATPGILTGDPVVQDSSHTIDSIIIRGTQGFTLGQTVEPIYLDFVAINPAGSIGNLLSQVCRNTPDVGGISGPIEAGDSSVVVLGASTSLNAANGDAIYVYADNVRIGELTSGFDTTTGTNTVPLHGGPPQVTLVKGQRLTATQKINGQEGCMPDLSTGLIVGGGNSTVRLTLSVRDKPGLSGPLGADGGTGGKLVWVGTDAAVGGSPQGTLFSPSTCWQTVEFNPTTDPRLNFAGTGDGTNTLANLPWGEIEHLAVAMNVDGPNTGPYTLYIDDVENGSEGLLTGFESGESQPVDLDQANVLFSLPSFSGSTSGNLLALPDVSVVTDEQAYNGDRSLKMRWQFKSEDTSSWVRLTAATNNNHPYQNPMIRLDKPVRMRILFLPPGQTAAAHPQIDVQPVDITNTCAGEAASLQVTASGSNALAYQWLKSADGIAPYAPIGGATGATYNFNVAAEDVTSLYRVEVKDTVSGCVVESNAVRVHLAPVILQQPVSQFLCAGQPATFSVTAAAPHTTYQWKENGVALANGNGISGAQQSTLTISPADGTRHGNVYTVEVGNGCTPAATVLSNPAVLTLVNHPPTIVSSTATGLVPSGEPASVSVGGFSAQYFNVATGTSPSLAADAVPVLIRLDPLIDFNWGAGSPDATVNADGFIVRWQGKVIAPATGDYTFYSQTDDGVRVYVNDSLVIDHWADMGNVEWCGPGTTSPGTCTVVPLTAGQVVDIRMEVYENAGSAAARLSWAGPGLPKQVLSPLAVKWTRNGELLPGQTSTRISVAAMSGASAGIYVAEYVDPCTGAIVVTPAASLQVFADYTGDGQVNTEDLALFSSCASGPDVPFTAVEPCKAIMDSDGDGDVDQDDFGALQVQIGLTP